MSRNKKISDKITEKRNALFPHINPDFLWNRHNDNGFTTVPRTLPIILRIIDDLTNGAPASNTYLSLWCKSFDEMYLSLSNYEILAFESGFNGQRAVKTWQDRMKKLKELGFIESAEGSKGEFSSILLLNPYFVIRKHYEEKTQNISQKNYNVLLERATEIDAKDMIRPIPSLFLETD
jgi:hypothetical protein